MSRLGVLVTLLVLPLAACAGEPPEEPAVFVDTTADPGDPPPTEASIRERCASQLPPDAPIRDVRVLGEGEGESGTRVPAVVIGPERPSETVMVLLHQVGTGLCGWGRFATRAAERGVTSVLVDLCGYGDATCPEGSAGEVSARLGLDLATTELGAERTALVGASMGGSETVLAVAGGTEVDVWVDVSGPSSWAGVDLLSVAHRVERPGLVVYARSDGETEYAAGRALARRTGAEFLDGGRGHGYELLTDFEGALIDGGERVLAFAQGG
ncbi:alpha/beta fold hydrolase [Nocardioides sp. LHG3406-4]|uniref:alpha/beta fold hydrolase n=1 Tax=Nocardioides sp. LHG3406-4 TaxID=2804575 RepID=UPI003CFBA456